MRLGPVLGFRGAIGGIWRVSLLAADVGAEPIVSVVGATSVLSGSVNSEIRSSVAQDRANFIVTGKVSRPALKRG